MIRAFGIFNTNIPEDHKMMYGMAFPGDYLLTPDGIVRDKRFLPNYEYRPSATAFATARGSPGYRGRAGTGSSTPGGPSSHSSSTSPGPTALRTGSRLGR